MKAFTAARDGIGSDNLAVGDNIYEVDSKRIEAEESAFLKVQNLALQLA